MMITVHLTGGNKITADYDKIVFFNPMLGKVLPDVQDGIININTLHVVYMQTADEMEQKHSKIHGW